MITLADPETRQLERLVDWRLARFKDHPEWQDIRQEALIAAWRAVQAHPELRRIAVVYAASRWAALEYLRSTRCRQPCRERREHPAPLFVCWEEWGDERAPDPVPDLLERLAAHHIVGQLWPLLRDREREAVRLVYGAGLTYAAAGERLGCNHRNVYRLLQQGFDRYRRAQGLPESYATQNSGQRRARRREENRGR